jgi:nickel/cobalt exporter
MTNEIWLLTLTAASVAFMHTVLGPDHYLPFIVMSKAGKWSKTKTIWVTILCGIGHVGSSVVLGLVGIGLGAAIHKLTSIENFRGDLAGWALIAFGFLYMLWGIKRAYKNKSHTHIHVHEDGSYHRHEHNHIDEHAHAHEKADKKVSLTPWILFTVFVLGPCEPLIPIIMFPAAHQSTIGMIIVSLVFGIITITTMLGVVLLSLWGINLMPFGKIERFTHALAGFTIFISGLAISFLGL